MFKVLRADKDAYITDRVVAGERQSNSNTGLASSLDLFKLYGVTSSGSSPNIELSRLLVHFDLNPIRSLIASGTLDTTNSTFTCKLRLFDVDGGQTVPSNYTLNINPLSASFDEGFGRDVVRYDDVDACNFLTASRSTGSWYVSGANQGGDYLSNVDYITTIGSTNVQVSQAFNDIEDLNVDVTRIVSATLSGIIPDQGYRIAFTQSIETDQRSYFVKRFASRHAYDSRYHPRLEITFDDSIQDDSMNLRLGSSGTLFLYNFSNGSPANLTINGTSIVGSNCLALTLQTPVSGGFVNIIATGSQHKIGSNDQTGVYSASLFIPESSDIMKSFFQSGSVVFTPIWGSLDGATAFLTGTKLYALGAQRGPTTRNDQLNVHVTNVNSDYKMSEKINVRVTFFDPLSEDLFSSHLPINATGKVLRNSYYQVRCIENGDVIIPFDDVHNSTLISSDSDGMYFMFDADDLIPGKTYVIDVKTTYNGIQRTFNDASSPFRIII